MSGLFPDDIAPQASAQPAESAPVAVPPRTPRAPEADYLVLARKYRPQAFDDLVGQDVLVTTLRNAIAAGRLHHAYVLTGIRGVGKTTTARILAKALNCENGPSVTWAADDAQANAIAAGRHVDVLEFDAASHTGVDDIRDLFEGVNYQPAQGRYKVYIVDEVHMLSKQAFNALLKTLEEPPPHVKFIFATTEVNKIPVTVLSRCQRFDLRRVPVALLVPHFERILKAEGYTAEPAAVTQIARAADGSVRDGLSLLDQAIARSPDRALKASVVAAMLGLADRHRVVDLFEALMGGKMSKVMSQLADLYAHGHDPLLLLTELMTFCHLVTRLKVVPDLATSPDLSELERSRAVPLATALKMESLSRVYQMLLTGMTEAKAADRPFEAVEMALIRIAYLAPLPVLDALVAQTPAAAPVAASVTAASAATPKSVAAPVAPMALVADETPPWEETEPTDEDDSKKAPRPARAR